jgi:hypothetical protein
MKNHQKKFGKIQRVRNIEFFPDKDRFGSILKVVGK